MCHRKEIALDRASLNFWRWGMRKGIFVLIAIAILFFLTGLLDLNSQARQAKQKETTLQHEVTVTLKLVQTYVTVNKETQSWT